jgi:AraC-like DNA-binding protein
MAAELGCRIPIGLAAALVECGVSPHDVLATARLPLRLLDGPGRRVPVPDFFALWNAVRSVSGDANIGITLASSIKLDLTEPLFMAVLCAADVAGAIQIVSRYKRCLLEPQSLALRRDDARRQVVVTYAWAEDRSAPPQVLIDAELAFIVEMCRRGTRQPELAPRELHLRTVTLDAGADHAALFRCPIRLGSDDNAIVFAAEDVERPFLTHNPQMLSALVPYLEASTPRSANASLARVRSVIAERVRGQRPTVRTVGKELAMSGRALQRVLRENGTSFRRLLDDVRNQHAHEYLKSTSYSDAEVAFLLGFEEANSFYRAFRAWNGVSPSDFRRSRGVA